MARGSQQSLTLSSERNVRTVSFLALPDVEEVPIVPMMFCLILVSMSEGLDACLFPSVTAAIEEFENFDVSYLGYIATFQLLFQAAGGPMWGVIASRGMMTRKNILMICTFFQGLATALMWININNLFVLCSLRAVNGVMLAGLRPIANSIVGDRFDDAVRGKYFGQIMGAMQLGVAIGTFLTISNSKAIIIGDATNVTLRGWQAAFIAIGGFTMALAPLIFFLLVDIPVSVAKEVEGPKENELQAICRLLKRPTFCMLVFQGCFGLIPWRAFDFRDFFLSKVGGLDQTDRATIGAFGGMGAVIGSLLGGPIGDLLHKIWPHHGRVLCAEISVYGGIPIAYACFQLRPADFGMADSAFWYYFGVTLLLGLVATWTPAGTNNPVLCALALPHERALILSWQTSLEGSVGALGPVMFSVLLKNVFGYDARCNDEKFEDANKALCDNVGAAGSALVWTSCGPWLICGMMYSSLHYTYPRDLAAIESERAASDGLELPTTVF